MTSAIRCAATCIIDDAEVRKSKAGTEFLSLTAHPIDNKDERLWITVGSKSKCEELLLRLKPHAFLYVEGDAKIRRWEASGISHAALSISADVAEVLFDIEARPKPKKKEAERPLESAAAASTASSANGRSVHGDAGGQSDRPLASARHAEEGQAPISMSSQNGSRQSTSSAIGGSTGPATIASRSEPSAPASYCAGPAAKSKGATHERPFDDEIPF